METTETCVEFTSQSQGKKEITAMEEAGVQRELDAEPERESTSGIKKPGSARNGKNVGPDPKRRTDKKAR